MTVDLNKLANGTPKIIDTAGKSRRNLTAFVVFALLIGGGYFANYKTADIKSLEVGTDAVVMGNVQAGRIGDGSVVIGPDADGNVRLNQPMTVGRNAHVAPGSIVIGAGAGAK